MRPLGHQAGRRRWPATGRGAAALLAALVILGACGGDDPPPTGSAAPTPAVERRLVKVKGVDQRYRLFTPAYLDDRPAALVLALHGGGNTADSFVEATQLDRAATVNAFIVAYPDAPTSVWNGGVCCTGGRGSAATEVGFLEQVVNDISAVRRVDPARVYAVGVSAGGVMAYRLGCDLAGRLAGVAAVAGYMQPDDCHPSRPLSVLAINGTADQLVPYQGGEVLPEGVATRPAPPTSEVAERWAALDGCPGEGDIELRGTVTTRTWTGCGAGTAVRLITLQDGGHNWYATEFGLPDGAVDATDAILAFFDLVRRP